MLWDIVALVVLVVFSVLSVIGYMLVRWGFEEADHHGEHYFQQFSE